MNTPDNASKSDKKLLTIVKTHMAAIAEAIAASNDINDIETDMMYLAGGDPVTGELNTVVVLAFGEKAQKLINIVHSMDSDEPGSWESAGSGDMAALHTPLRDDEPETIRQTLQKGDKLPSWAKLPRGKAAN